MRDSSAVSSSDHDEFDSSDSTTFWRKDFSVPAAPSGRSRWLQWACVVISTILLISLIISMSLTKSRVDSRFSDIEKEVKNVTQLSLALITRIQQLEKHGDDVVQKLNQMKISVNSLQTQSNNFFTEVKNTQEVVAQMKCSISALKNNRTEDQCCLLDWSLYLMNCYYFSDEGKSWNEARDECERRNAELLVLKSPEEKEFVIKHTKPFYYWLGLSDERTGQWEWLDGTPYHMDKREWMPGQPDNWMAHGLGGGEDCAHFHKDGRYNDDHCSRNYRYVCKAHALTH
ncbi:asialoglycoprotein receptor 1 [Trichomycterus rosablanca]|uniref:asialoglycoprotein receptor 1 n=1 Tax=Trichomycterus rosablanca TaxID=2290929 RepID=UPI002F34FF58